MNIVVRGVWNALAFLSRLAPPLYQEGQESENGIAGAVPFYPVAGLLLGGFATLPALAFSFALPQSSTWIPALLYVLILAWLTRGLHWDGLADLADACGSNATGDRFWEIIKDSRIGAFGVMALIFAIAAQVAAAQACISAGHAGALVFAPAFGRAMGVLPGWFGMPHPASTLAAATQPGIRSSAFLLALSLTLAASLALLGPGPFLAALGMAAVCLGALIRIARAHGGFNGDFLGSAIIVTETAFLFAGGI